MSKRPLRMLPVIVVTLLLGVAGAATAQDADTTLVAAVKRALSSNGDQRRLAVTASGGEVTLTGRLPTLWLKQDAVKRAMRVSGVTRVVADIELPRLSSDQNLAFYLGQAIDGYPYQTVFDYLDAVIRNGVVTLTGFVTGERKKAEEIAEEVSRVRGVQEVHNEIVTAPPSQGDEAIRESLYTRVFSNMHFDRFESVRNPPFRIVVHNGVVTLYGFVQGDLEVRELESIARFTSGVLRVENKLRTLTKPKG